jgi:hypothetical protein
LAARAPELAVLSALAHGGKDAALLDAAVASMAELDEERARAYFDLLRYHLGKALDRALEAIMATTEHKYLSDFARKYYDDGVVKGEAHRARAALRTVIRVRAIPASEEDLARIAACEDLTTLDRWLERAALATTMEEVFDE